MSIYRKRRRRNDTDIDDWLMTYADMITLLLCFFAIFLSISVPKEEQMQEARERVLERFAARSEVAQDKIIIRSPELKAPVSSGGMYDKLPSLVDYAHMQHEARQRSLQTQSRQRQEFEETKDDRVIGNRILTLEMPSAAVFASGSATLSEEGEGLLRDIIRDTLSAPQFADYRITVEGHTDDVPISTLQFPSNWELSTSRAAAVVRFFIQNGIAPDRLRAAGFGDSAPKQPNRDASGNPVEGNRAQNRRVVIKLEKIEKTR